MKGLIVDDDDIQRRLLHKQCDNSGLFSEIVELDSALTLIKYLQSHSADIILLDIHMPNFSGIDFIKSIKDRPNVIFITGDKDFALEAFEYDAIDYLVKPVEFPRFLKAVTKAKERIQQETNVSDTDKDYCFIKVDSRLIKMDHNNILFIEAKGDYVSFVTETKKYIVHTTLKKLLAELPSHLFQQSHRSFIVNMTKIKDIQDSTMVIHEYVVPIGRSVKKEFMQKLGL
jgi:two-component system, LytTR family, response regulator LytT